MKFAVVTPSFQQGSFLGATLASVAQQRGDYAVAYRVQDGGSTDGSVGLLREFSEATAGRADFWFDYESSRDGGQAAAINEGFDHLDGDVFAWLNSDDCYEPGAFSLVQQLFAEHPEIDVVYGQRRYVTAAGKPITVSGSPFSRWFLERIDFIPQETVFWRRRAFEAVGRRLDDSFQFCMDYDLWISFLKSGARFHYEPRILANFRVHPASKTRTAFREVGIPEINRVRRRSGHGPTTSRRYFATVLAYRGRYPLSRRTFWNPLGLKLRGY